MLTKPNKTIEVGQITRAINRRLIWCYILKGSFENGRLSHCTKVSW